MASLDGTNHLGDAVDDTRGDGCDDRQASMQWQFVSMVSLC